MHYLRLLFHFAGLPGIEDAAIARQRGRFYFGFRRVLSKSIG